MSRTPPVVPDLPELSSGASLAQVIEWAQKVRTQMIAREPIATGSTLDKFVTRGELVGLNVLQYRGGNTFGVGTLAGGGSGVIGGGGSGGSTDLTPPDPITTLTVTPGLTNFFVEFDAPTYTQGGGNAYTSIYAANYAGTGPLPTFSDAVEVYQVTGSATIAVIPAQPDQETHFWAGAVTVAGVRQVDGVGPTGGLHGVSATSGQDVTSLLNALTQAAENTGSPYSKIAFRADLFYIGNAAGTFDGIPFYVTTTSFTQNGVVVPPGVYMQNAFMANGTITNAMIGNLQVDNAKVANVSAGKLTAGSIAVGETIQSTGFVAGTSGWRITGNGTAEFSFAMIRGTLAAGQIAANYVTAAMVDSRGLTIKDASGTVILGVGANQLPANDSASALGFNPTFSAWSSALPDNWLIWPAVSSPSKNTSTVQGSPYSVEWIVTAGDVTNTGMGMTRSYTLGSALPAGTTLTGAFSAFMLGYTGSGTPGYLIRLYTNSAQTTFVDTIASVPNPGASGWQHVPFTATAGGAQIFAIQIYQMAGWNGMPGGMTSAGSGVVFGPFTFDVNLPIASTQLTSTINADIADRLSKSAPSILSSTVSINATTGAGFVAGTLTWNSAGVPTGGHGVAITPGGIVGVNTSSVTTFSIDAATGNAFFGGVLKSGIASTGAVLGSATSNSQNGSSVIRITSSAMTMITTTTSGGDVLITMNVTAAVMCNTNTPVQMQLYPLLDGSLYGALADCPDYEFTLTNSNPMQFAAGSGATAYNWGATQSFDLSFIIPAADIPAGSHTIGCQVDCHFWNASGTANIITGTSLYVRAKASLREFLA